MFDAPNPDSGMIQALWVTLIRAGVITQHHLLDTADEIAAAAERPGSDPEVAEQQRQLAHELKCILLSLDGPAETPGQFEERFHSRQRTQRIVRRFGIRLDGGNTDD